MFMFLVIRCWLYYISQLNVEVRTNCFYMVAKMDSDQVRILNYKSPPDLSDEKRYSVWKNEIAIWQLVTDLPKAKQALALTLGLQEKYREVALEISAEDLNKDEGMTILLAKLE